MEIYSCKKINKMKAALVGGLTSCNPCARVPLATVILGKQTLFNESVSHIVNASKHYVVFISAFLCAKLNKWLSDFSYIGLSPNYFQRNSVVAVIASKIKCRNH